ncbi:MAG: acyclic terpene utilization AtuA family protein [Thermodesulfobacteriota bacterium]|nr:acyclic terpene utilization AtuA family protein [Thermodesulfobacteriota bacterium]
MERNSLEEVRILAPTGMLGSGYLQSSLEEALSRRPHFIGCDAGSTDPGPFPLGSGKCAFSRDACKRDLRHMLVGARRLDIPLIIGSAGTAGGDIHLEWTWEILKEIAREEALHFKAALIHSEQPKEYIKKKFQKGKIKPLNPAPELNEEVIERSERIVGMMGVEPYIKALSEGAEVIVAGRSSDTALYAAYPIKYGFPEGLSWHAGKIVECGTAAVTQRKSPDCIMAYIRKDHFVVEPMDPALRCTPQSVAAHSLYENADPFYFQECSGTLDLSKATYEPISEKAVKVSGSHFIPASAYTVKLEGAEKVGYQSIIIGGIRDPIIVGQIDDWIGRLQGKIEERIKEIYGGRLSKKDYFLNFRLYGKDGTMGALEPVKEIRSHEIGLIIEITAPTQEIASSIATSARHLAIHNPVPQWSGLITSLACLYNPAHLERGAVYRFNLNHIVEPDDPFEMFPMEVIRV